MIFKLILVLKKVLKIIIKIVVFSFHIKFYKNEDYKKHSLNVFLCKDYMLFIFGRIALAILNEGIRNAR